MGYPLLAGVCSGHAYATFHDPREAAVERVPQRYRGAHTADSWATRGGHPGLTAGVQVAARGPVRVQYVALRWQLQFVTDSCGRPDFTLINISDGSSKRWTSVSVMTPRKETHVAFVYLNFTLGQH